MDAPAVFGWMLDDILHTNDDNSINMRPDEIMDEEINDVIEQVGGFTVKPLQT